ncbi:hypothetical protein ABW19_dt0200439 [Dactylella cylindrospora]|nr:hypothetical protein ABW19_dt0200439 [Dactylella cylindrospora]
MLSKKPARRQYVILANGGTLKEYYIHLQFLETYNMLLAEFLDLDITCYSRYKLISVAPKLANFISDLYRPDAFAYKDIPPLNVEATVKKLGKQLFAAPRKYFKERLLGLISGKSAKLKPGDTLTIFFCCQAMTESGDLLHGKQITKQEIIQSIGKIPAGVNILLISISWGSASWPVLGQDNPWEWKEDLRGTKIFPTACLRHLEINVEGKLNDTVELIKEHCLIPHFFGFSDVGTKGSSTHIFVSDPNRTRFVFWNYQSPKWAYVSSVTSCILKMRKFVSECSLRIVPTSNLKRRFLFGFKQQLANPMKTVSLPIVTYESYIQGFRKHGQHIYMGALTRLMRLLARDPKSYCTIGPSREECQRQVDNTLRWVENADIQIEILLHQCVQDGELLSLNHEKVVYGEKETWSLHDWFYHYSTSYKHLIRPEGPDYHPHIMYHKAAMRMFDIIRAHEAHVDGFEIEDFVAYMDRYWSLQVM